MWLTNSLPNTPALDVVKLVVIQKKNILEEILIGNCKSEIVFVEAAHENAQRHRQLLCHVEV
jgi:hypothetical protein